MRNGAESAVIQGSDLTYAYGERRVVDGVDVTTSLGKVLGLIGPNGSGKTTLLRMLYGSLAPAAGQVSIDGTALSAMALKDVARKIAVVVQESENQTTLTVAEMVMLGRSPYLKTFENAGEQDHRLVTDALSRLGVLHLARRPFSWLSGGERQRVLIARALAQHTRYLFLDEPTNHLDVRYQHEVLSMIHESALTVVLVLHDLNLAAQYCDELILLDDGRAVARGTPHDVLTPERLEPLYQIAVTRIALEDKLHLLFQPRVTSSADEQRVAVSP